MDCFVSRFYWMHNATAYNHAYADSGVFCVHASSHPSQLWELVDIITREFIRMAGAIEEADLSVRFQPAELECSLCPRLGITLKGHHQFSFDFVHY